MGSFSNKKHIKVDLLHLKIEGVLWLLLLMRLRKNVASQGELLIAYYIIGEV